MPLKHHRIALPRARGRRCLQYACFGMVMLGSLWNSDPSLAESLWKKRDQRTAFLFTDTRARRVGDLLIVQINEVTGIDEQDERQMDKSTLANGTFSFSGESDSNGVGRSASADFTSSQTSNRTFDAASEYESDRSFTDQITVTVVDVLPNRNLLIEGSRTRVIAGDERVMRISGMVRPDDIELGNIVPSRVIANFKIVYEGKGQAMDYTNHGWLGKFVTKIWPF